VIRTRDGTRAFDIIAFLEYQLRTETARRFSPFGQSPHQPRITIDHLVVCREGWTFAPAEIGFAAMARGAGQFAAARRWARDRGLPRRVFVRVPEEWKPIYLDLDSPILIELAAKLIRRGSTVKITEMLPDLDHSWLRDEGGRRYTSELRMVALDPRPWRGPRR
jgi:hypothetical protein